MIKIIKTQSGEIVNFNHIINIAVMEGDITEGERITPLKAYAVVATDIRGEDHQLVVCDKADEADAAIEEITAWLAFSTSALHDLSDSDE